MSTTKESVTMPSDDRVAMGDVTVKSQPKEETQDEEDSIRDLIESVKEVAALVDQGQMLKSQAILQKNLLGRSTKRRRHSSPTRKDASSSSHADEHDPENMDIAWDLFKRWPQGIEQEERATGDYFRRLKMIQLEQETRNIFVHDTNDDSQTIYSLSDVRALEGEVGELKAQLQARKRKAREYRAAIEGLVDRLGGFDQVKGDLQQAQQLSDRIDDDELELARLNAIHGFRSARNADDKDQLAVPPLGAFTRDEADDLLARQLLAMETLENEQTSTLKAIEAAKRQLAISTQTNDRLNAERSVAERAATEAQAEKGQRKRNVRLEAICRGYAATTKLFESMMGIASIDAPTSTCVRAVYEVSNVEARRFCERVAIELHFDELDDRLRHVEFTSTSGRSLTSAIAPKGSRADVRLQEALEANDAALLLQESLICIESTQNKV